MRELTDEEGRRLVRTTRTSRDRVRLRRATIVLTSARGRPARDIATLAQSTVSYVSARSHPRVRRPRLRGAGPKMERGRANKDG